MGKLSTTLEDRGYVYQNSADSLAEITDGKKRTLYLGIDPTADSLHVGHLQNLLILKLFIEDGHKVISLVGGGTGMIGDPSGKSEERNLLDEETIQKNASAVEKQIASILESTDFKMVNNADWLSKESLLDFLREIGKYLTVNDMLRKDSVRTRVEGEGQSISYTEFSYQILQAYDFLHLFEKEGCDLQIGASDQWGNIASGIELIRKKTGKTVYGFTAPLLVDKKTGKKFGKTEGGAIWLDPEKTSPFDFYQFWLNTDDDSVEMFLKRMTTLSIGVIEDTIEKHVKDPSKRVAQKLLAGAVTELVHGAKISESISDVSGVLFGTTALEDLSEDSRGLLMNSAPTCETRIGELLVDVLVRSGLSQSKTEAKQHIVQGAITLNGAKVTDGARDIMQEDFQNAPMAILKRGKRNVCVLIK